MKNYVEIIENNTIKVPVTIQENTGIQGPQGYTPYIGSNQHWFINGNDTGIIAGFTEDRTPIVIVYAESIYQFPVIGNINTLYIDTGNNEIYRWDDTNIKYTKISSQSPDIIYCGDSQTKE